MKCLEVFLPSLKKVDKQHSSGPVCAELVPKFSRNGGCRFKQFQPICPSQPSVFASVD